MYALPDDRTSPLLAQLAQIQSLRGQAPGSFNFQAELASARNEVAHLMVQAAAVRPAAAPAGCTRRTRLFAAA